MSCRSAHFSRETHCPLKKVGTSPHYTIPMVTQIIEFSEKKVNKLFMFSTLFYELPKYFCGFWAFCRKKIGSFVEIIWTNCELFVFVNFSTDFWTTPPHFSTFFTISLILGTVFLPFLRFSEISTTCWGNRFSPGQFVGGEAEMKNKWWRIVGGVIPLLGEMSVIIK